MVLTRDVTGDKLQLQQLIGLVWTDHFVRTRSMTSSSVGGAQEGEKLHDWYSLQYITTLSDKVAYILSVKG